MPRPTSQGNLLAGVTQLRDALQKILDGTDPGVSFLKLAGLGDHSIDFGTGAAAWTASQFSAIAAVNHRLGVTPVFWAAFSSDAGQVITYFTGAAPSSTTVTFQGWASASISGTKNFVWVAIG